MNRPDVSFIIPAYNAERFIARAIDSIRAQNGCNFEIIVADDASTDATAETVREIARTDPRVRLVTLPQNSGSPALPRRIAAQNASADIIALLDSDDWIEENYLQIMWAEMRQSGADIVFPTMYIVENDETPRRFVPSEEFDYSRPRPGKDLVALTLDGWQIGCAGGLINRDLYLRCFDSGQYSGKFFTDEVLSRHLLIEAPKVKISTAKYFYAMEPESITHHIGIHAFDFLEADRMLVDLIARLLPDDENAKILAARQLFHGYFRAIELLARAKTMHPRERKLARRKIALQKNYFDLPVLRRHASPRYLLLSRLGIGPAAFILRILKKSKT